MPEITAITESLKKDIIEGLSSRPKFIPSKYFYDDEGSRIFQDIMQMDEYYPTNCEIEIIGNEKQNILSDISMGQEDFDLIELGAGDGLKTSILIDHFINSGAEFKYIPIDISLEAIEQLVEKMEVKFPSLRLSEQVGDYFEILGNLNVCSSCRKLVLFLGSNIGNYNHEEGINFFKHLSSVMNSGDMVLTGFDLVKDPDIILRAYNDASGHTRRFNLNLLTRLNRELGADFDLKNFFHHPIYEPSEQAAKSYLISTENQEVFIRDLNKKFSFQKWEPIFTEISRKFTMHDINELALFAGFRVVKNFTDRRGYFLNSLWEKV